MNAYSIDFTRRTVTISKAFADKAAEYNSFEYKMIVDLQNQGYTVVKRTHATPTNRKPMPTYAQMEHYLSMVENSDFYTEQYKQLLLLATMSLENAIHPIGTTSLILLPEIVLFSD